MEMKTVELCNIKASQHNSRRTIDEAKLKELADSIKEKGVIVPIILRPSNGKFEIVCGERRFKASQLAQKKDIPALILELDDKQAMEFQIIENLQREDVHPLEEAEGYEVLMKKHGYKDVKDIAAKVGKSATYIYGRLKLCELIPENRKYFYDGKFSSSVALLVARVSKDRQKEVGKEVATNEENYGDGRPMTYEEAKEYIEQNFMLQIKEAAWDLKEKGLANKISCTECPKRTANEKELFADIKGSDQCTDPGCFNAKKQAYTQRKLAELKKAGKKIIPTEEVGKALSYNSNYIKLEDTCYQAELQGRRPTYRDLAKKAKDADIIYAISPDNGKLIELITKPEAARILRKLGVKGESEDTKTRGAKIAENKKENRVTMAKRVFWIEKIQKHMDARVKDVLFLGMLLGDLSNSLEGVVLVPKSEEDIVNDAPMDSDFEELYKLGEEKVKRMIARAVLIKPERNVEDDHLEFLSTKLGFSMVKDYVITKEYLEACTKDELAKLAKELGIHTEVVGMTEDKKSAMVAAILKHAPKGKVPKELVK